MAAAGFTHPPPPPVCHLFESFTPRGPSWTGTQDGPSGLFHRRRPLAFTNVRPAQRIQHVTGREALTPTCDVGAATGGHPGGGTGGTPWTSISGRRRKSSPRRSTSSAGPPQQNAPRPTTSPRSSVRRRRRSLTNTNEAPSPPPMAHTGVKGAVALKNPIPNVQRWTLSSQCESGRTR